MSDSKVGSIYRARQMTNLISAIDNCHVMNHLRRCIMNRLKSGAFQIVTIMIFRPQRNRTTDDQMLTIL
jgi:hypothetical protein